MTIVALFLVPVILISLKTEDAVQSFVQAEAEQFVDESRAAGYISPENYLTFVNSIGRAGFEPRIIRETESIETLLLYVETGVGVALLSANTRLTTDPSVRLIPLEDVLFDTVAYWHTDPLRPAVQAMIEPTLLSL